MQIPGHEEGELNWRDVVSSFRVLPAGDVLAMEQMERHQNLKDKVHWLDGEEQPLALLFISHRWQTLEHPDPTGQQFKIIQEFLRRICICVEAMLVPARERLQLVPSLLLEGALQAEEVVRRMFGSGPFAGVPACIGGRLLICNSCFTQEPKVRTDNQHNRTIMSRNGLLGNRSWLVD